MTQGRTLGPSVWAVSDGRAGNAAQVRAVVQALADTHRYMRVAHMRSDAHRSAPVVLHPRAPWTWLPADRWPSPLGALAPEERCLFDPPHPDVWIAAGRRSAPFTRLMRQRSAGKTLCVHILDPKIPASEFDLLVTPEHDGIDGPNVIRTIGSPAHFSPEAMEDAGQAFADLADEKRKSAIVVLGGNSKTHTFTFAAAERLAEDLRALSVGGWRLRITCSRRTPDDIAALFRGLSDQIGAQFWAGPPDGPNPYLAWLIYSTAAIVTEDSANMLSDAAWHGLPVHIARLEGRAVKFDNLHKSFIDRGIARPFSGKLDVWSYEPLREAERVADAIVGKLLERHPAPVIS